MLTKIDPLHLGATLQLGYSRENMIKSDVTTATRPYLGCVFYSTYQFTLFLLLPTSQIQKIGHLYAYMILQISSSTVFLSAVNDVKL